MTDRPGLDQLTSNDLDQLYAELDRLTTELRRYTEADSADAAAGSYAGRAEHAEAERDRYRQAILDIDAHATPIGLAHQDDPDGNPHHYAVTVGALHRALGKVGHTATPCTAEAAVTRVHALADRWVKAGPPPLGTSVSRWWDARLIELNAALDEPGDLTGAYTPNPPIGCLNLTTADPKEQPMPACTATIQGPHVIGGGPVQCTREVGHPENHVGLAPGTDGKLMWNDHNAGATPHQTGSGEQS